MDKAGAGRLEKIKATMGFIALNGVFALLFIILLLRGVEAGRAKSLPPVENFATHQKRAEKPALEAFNNAYARPVFHHDRHAAKPPEEISEADAAEVLKLELTGILALSPEVGWAFVRTPGAEETVQIAIGGEISGWRLTRLEKFQATLVKGGRESVLALAGSGDLGGGTAEDEALLSQPKPRTRQGRP